MKDFSKVRERVSRLNIIDDTLFQKMAEDEGFCEELISTIMRKKIKVVQVVPQGAVKNLQGRSVIVDALCEKEDGTFCSVEVQKANQDDHQRRVRYNASCITANIENPGERFKDIPDLTVIYISRFDMFRKGKTVYHIIRSIRETGDVVHNGLEEIYVNAKVNDGSDIAELMQIFTETDAYNYEKFPKVSKRKAQFKLEEKGEQVMCEIVEEYAKEYAEEYAKEYAEEYAKEYAEEYAKEYAKENEGNIVRKMLKSGISVEQAIGFAEVLTADEVRKIAETENQIKCMGV